MPTADYQETVEHALEAVDRSNTIHSENADLLNEYRRNKQLNGMSVATQQRNISYLKKLAEQAGNTPFTEMDKVDIKGLVGWVHDQDLADETVDTYKKAIRSFWRWLNDGTDLITHTTNYTACLNPKRNSPT